MKENEKSAGTPNATFQDPELPGDEALKLSHITRNAIDITQRQCFQETVYFLPHSFPVGIQNFVT